MKGIYIIINIITMQKIVDFINYIKGLGFVVIDWFIDFKSNFACIVCSANYIYCFCCGKDVSTITKKFYIILCDDCKLQFHHKLNMMTKEHGFFVPYLDFIKV